MSYKTYKIIEDDKVVFEFNVDAIFCDHCKNSLSIAEALKEILKPHREMYHKRKDTGDDYLFLKPSDFKYMQINITPDVNCSSVVTNYHLEVFSKSINDK